MKKILPIIIFIAISIGALSYTTGAYAAVTQQEKNWAIEASDAASQANQSGSTALGEFGATNDAYFQILSANDAGKLTNSLSKAELADLLSKKNYTYGKSQAAKNAALAASDFANCAEMQTGLIPVISSVINGCGKGIEGDKIAAVQSATDAANYALDISTYSDYMVNFLKSHLKNPADYTDVNTTSIENSRIAASNAPVIQECSFSHPGVCLRQGFGWFLYLILSLVAALAKFGGYLLDSAVRYTVLDMSDHIHQLSSIDVVWKVFRDLCNLSFIFILLYVAVQTILQINNANPLRVLRQIVIAAILINFSLFIAKLIIDFSNIFTLAFYNQMIGKTGTMSGAIMNLFGIQALWGDKMNVVQTWSQSWSTLFSMTAGSIIITFTAAFSFLAAAWLFLLRYVVLILVFMLAPIGFMGAILPQVKNASKRWFDALIGQALFPPIYMLLMWVTLKVGQNINGLKGDFGTALSLSQRVNLPTGTGILNPVIRFVILIVLMNFALILAKTQAGRVGGRVQKIMEGGLKTVEGARKVTQGYIGRGVVRGAGLNRLDEKFKKTAFANTRLGSYVQKNTTGIAAGAKFGSKHSVGDVDKDIKKLKKDFASEQDKEAERQADKTADTPEKLLAHRTAKVASIKSEIANVERDARTNLDITMNASATPTEQRAASDKYEASQDRLKTLNTERAKAEVIMNTTGLAATQDERKDILKKVRTQMADKLYSPEDIKKDEASKKADADRSGIRKVAGAVFNPVRLYRRLTENEDSKGRNVRREAAKVLRDKAKGKGDSLTELLKLASKEAGVGEDTKPAPAAPTT